MNPATVDCTKMLDQIDAMDALDALRQAEVPMALIHDEYGHFEGIVTPADLLAAIAGEFASDADPDDAPSVVERDDGSLLVAGNMAADALAERLERYHLLHAVRADLLRRLGRDDEADRALEAALARTDDPDDQALLAARRGRG